ncbi:alpha/beta fold hydrolase [Lactococcus fujiensis]|uniref:alpha/beta fold hydrolase n=1 Tax=Lactococcus fujiensis TaxID=610251 RepID=UPI0006D18D83|nr:alpha/beta hydrolase [Lactococcus fujiensis]
MSYSIQDFTLTNGCPSRLLIVSPDNVPTNAVIQFVYGFGEHIEMFEEFGRFFAENGFAFVVHDQQGHGLRAKENHTQGIVSTYQDFLDDITLVRKKIDADFQNLPIILFGFSMGGNIVLNYLLTYPDAPYIKTVAQSPWLRLAKPQPKLADFLAAAIGKLTPKPTLNAKLDFEKKLCMTPKALLSYEQITFIT